MEQKTTWKLLVAEALSELPAEFDLDNVLVKRKMFERAYPSNRFIDAKIRQTLQVLRDQGAIEFLGHGRYRQRTVRQPVMTTRIDPGLASAYKSRSQMGRVVIETWAELNLYCINCAADSLLRLPDNTPLADLECPACELRFQLKSKEGRFLGPIVGAAYQPLLAAIRQKRLPAYILVEYDLRFASIVYVTAVPGPLITEERVKARAPLAATARRAGWVGCSIDLRGLPEARIVEPAPIAKESARAQWRSLQ